MRVGLEGGSKSLSLTRRSSTLQMNNDLRSASPKKGIKFKARSSVNLFINELNVKSTKPSGLQEINEDAEFKET